jgi:hypothetical protein
VVLWPLATDPRGGKRGKGRKHGKRGKDGKDGKDGKRGKRGKGRTLLRDYLADTGWAV